MDLSKYNIIENDEELIETVDNIMQAFLESIRIYLNNSKKTVTDKIMNNKEEYDFIVELEKDVTDKIISMNTAIKVKYNNMGCYYYEII